MMDWQVRGLSTLTQPLFQLGSTSISAATLLSAAVFVVGIWWLASIIERGMVRLALQRTGDENSRSRVHMISRLLRYAVWVLGTLIGLNQLGIDLSSVTLLGSAFAVGLGFGLQNVVSNFVSGLIILVERSLKVGDFVDLESGVRGHVREIAMRYTRVTTNDEIDVLVPNSEFINNRVINWTFDDAHRRIKVPFGVAYGTAKELVREAGSPALSTEAFTVAVRRRGEWLSQKALAAAHDAGLNATATLAVDTLDPVGLIVRIAQARSCDAIVVSCEPSNAVTRLCTGSLVPALVTASPVPVVIVHDKTTGADTQLRRRHARHRGQPSAAIAKCAPEEREPLASPKLPAHEECSSEGAAPSLRSSG